MDYFRELDVTTFATHDKIVEVIEERSPGSDPMIELCDALKWLVLRELE